MTVSQSHHPIKRYYTVQALRGLAALFVVMYHATKMLHDRLDPSIGQFYAGGAGVDVFFAISGFVIVMTSASSWGQAGNGPSFLGRRMERIVPLYWLMTALKLALLLGTPALAQHSAVQPWHTLASFLFIPAWNVEHNAFPLVTVGWTLSFEMLFYLLFATAIAFARPVPVLSVVLLALAAIGLLRTDDWGAAATLLDPILIEFIFGMWIGMAVLKGRNLPVSLASAAIPLMVVALIATNLLPEELCIRWRVILWGVPGAVLLLSAIALEKRWGARLTGLPSLLGDASYAIYLSHGFILPFVGILLSKLHWTGTPGMVFAFGLCLVLSCIAGVLIHRRVERPLIMLLRKIHIRVMALPLTFTPPACGRGRGREAEVPQPLAMPVSPWPPASGGNETYAQEEAQTDR